MPDKFVRVFFLKVILIPIKKINIWGIWNISSKNIWGIWNILTKNIWGIWNLYVSLRSKSASYEKKNI